MNQTDMPYRPLGDTGEQVSVIGVGGWHLALKHVDEQPSLAHCCVRPSTVASISWTTHGITTMARAKSAWAGP